MIEIDSRSSLLEHPKKLLLYLLLVDLLFVVMFPLSIESGSWTLGQWFDLKNERSIPTWYSSSQLLVSGLLVLLASNFRSLDASGRRAFYFVVGLGLIFLSADEASSIHERLTPIAARHAEFIPLFPGNHGAWIAIYGVIGAALIAVNSRNIFWMWKYHRRALTMFCAGFAVLVAGGVVVEIAMYYSIFASDVLQLSLEEGLEMVGGSMVFVSAAIFLRSHGNFRASTPEGALRRQSASFVRWADRLGRN